MTWDDFVYALLLLVSVLFGPFLQNVPLAFRQLLATLVGLLMSFIVCGTYLWHSILTTLIAIIIMQLSPKRYISKLCFIWCFTYLSFFRTAHFFGFNKPPPHSNAVQLLLTLRLVGVAFEISDTFSLSEKSHKEALNPEDKRQIDLKYRYEGVKPSAYDLFNYAYCYIGLLTGPYFKYRVYEDMIFRTNMKDIPRYDFLFDRMRQAPIYGIAYLISSYYYTIEYVKTDIFFDRSFFYRLLYMVIMFFVFRMRMYFAWIMSECVCMSAGLGAYPVASAPRCGMGPTDLEVLEKLEKFTNEHTKSGVRVEYNFNTIHNIDVWGCEMAPTVREGMKSWNMTVQFWLAHYIYRRVPFRSVRTSLTMLVSAYWHGVHPGYYLSFLTIPPTLMAEGALARLLNSPTHRRLYLWTAWLLKMRCFDYMCMGFLLLELGATLHYWASIYFVMHFVIVGLIVADKVTMTTS